MHVSRTSLTTKTFGNPKKVLALPENEKRYLIGTIFGTASGVKEIKRRDPKTDAELVYYPIVGNFAAIASEPVEETIDGKTVSVDEFRSGTLYLPQGIHEQLAEVLKPTITKVDGKDVSTPPTPIKFAIEVYTVKASNAAGYTYECRPVIDTDVSDPLTEMRKSLVGKTKLLPAPKAEAAGGKKAA